MRKNDQVGKLVWNPVLEKFALCNAYTKLL